MRNGSVARHRAKQFAHIVLYQHNFMQFTGIVLLMLLLSASFYR